jgi:RNA polymerase sigma-70 factor (ECF subfamily)
MLERFMEIAATGDRKKIVQLFAADAVATSDGGGKAIAVQRPLHGAERISYLYHALARNFGPRLRTQVVAVNGELGIAYYWDGALRSLMAIETDGEVIHSIYTIRNPDKLRAYAAG